jgi:glycosyltransferase involved in cell wall biosynthesis
MVLLESMAAGCPIIASNVGGVSKIIDNEQHGILVDSKRPDKLSEAIIRLLTDDKLRKKIISQSIQRFNEKFSAAHMTKQYEGLYLRL